MNTPFARPLYVMPKPAGASCNLRCTYCYYLDKKDLYPDAGPHLMSDELLERFVSQYLGAQTQPEVLFTWHGGEPLLRGLDFYKKALALQRQYGEGRRITNTIQTNGTLLDDAWCRFFKENDFLVGISIDGSQPFHDACRKTAAGGPTFEAVMRGVELLKKYGVEYNAMGVVSSANAAHPEEFYRFFKQIDARYIQFAPVVERGPDGELTPESVDPDVWGDFLIGLFDEWVQGDVGRFFISYFDAALANWVGVESGMCIFAETCGHAGALEWNGDLYVCDHYVFPEYRLGNLRENTLMEMMYSPRQLAFGAAKRNALPQQCCTCRFGFACRGECPKNRIAATAQGEPGLNYLCRGYYRFFEHIAPYMEAMKRDYLSFSQLKE